MFSWKFWDDFDPDGQLDSIAPSVNSTPTARPDRNHLDFFQKFAWIQGRNCPYSLWGQVYIFTLTRGPVGVSAAVGRECRGGAAGRGRCADWCPIVAWPRRPVESPGRLKTITFLNGYWHWSLLPIKEVVKYPFLAGLQFCKLSMDALVTQNCRVD